MTKEMERHEATLDLQQQEGETMRTHSESQLESLQRRIDELQLSVEAYNVLEVTNISLRKRVDELIAELELDGRVRDKSRVCLEHCRLILLETRRRDS